MKFGMRKPSLKKSFKARTTGKAKRMLNKAINPLYGKKGMGIINNPKKAIYNKIYNKTTFGINDIIKINSNRKKKKEKFYKESLYEGDEKINMYKNSDKNNDSTKMKKSDIIRYIVGIIFILGGIGGITSGDVFLGGLVMIIFGISFLPIIYKLLKCPNNKVIQIVTPIILFFITFALIPNSDTVTTTNATNIISNETVKNINTNTNVNKITNESNDSNTNTIQTENKIEEDKEIKKENTTQTIVSNENTKKDNEKTSTVEKETEKNTNKPATTNKTETTTTQTTKDNSRTVYRTPSGKRYHYDPDCGGKNSYSITLNSAISSGLTPCKKCAQ